MEVEKRKIEPQTTLRVDSRSIQEIFNLTGQLVLLKNQLLDNPEIRIINNQFLHISLNELDTLIRKIEESVLSLRLNPIRPLFLKAHRIALEISKKLNRPLDFHYQGEDTLIDREMIDILSDILPHLIRNAIDHGIEPPEERALLGKKEVGTISISAQKSGNQVIICLTDDGRGINRDKVIQKAIEKGILDPKQNLNNFPDSDIFNLLFQSGFSTSDEVTDISGRGVGLEVGKRVIEKLRGRFEINNMPGVGLEILMILPLNTTIMDALIVEINQIKYLIGINEVVEIINLKNRIIKKVPLSKKFVIYRDAPIPFIEPIVLFSQTKKAMVGKERPVGIIFIHNGRPMALQVDNVFNQSQIVLNPAEYEFLSSKNFVSGTAVLSDGHVSQLLDIHKLAQYHLDLKVSY